MSQDNFNVLQVGELLDECLIAKKIYGRCKQQDCLKPIGYDVPPMPPFPIPPVPPLPPNSIPIPSTMNGEAYPVTNALVGTAVFDGTIAVDGTVLLNDGIVAVIEKPFKTDIRVLHISSPGPFSLPGYYDVTIQYTFSYNIQFFLKTDVHHTPLSFLINTPTPTTATTLCGYTTYTKVVSLSGGVVDSDTHVSICDTGVHPSHSFKNYGNKPYAYVQAIASPIASKVTQHHSIGKDVENHIDVVIGLFTIIELYRIANMTVASNGPIDIPQCEPTNPNDPCTGFNQLAFPYDDFDPPYRDC